MLLLGLKTQIYCVHTSYKHRIYIVDNPILKKTNRCFEHYRNKNVIVNGEVNKKNHIKANQTYSIASHILHVNTTGTNIELGKGQTKNVFPVNPLTLFFLQRPL